MATTDDELQAIHRAAELAYWDTAEVGQQWRGYFVGLQAVFEAGRREGAETAAQFAEGFFQGELVRVAGKVLARKIRALPTETGTPDDIR